MSTPAYFGNSAANDGLAAIFGPGGYLGLSVGTPNPLSLADPLQTECSGAGYARQLASFSLGARAALLAGGFTYTGVNAATVNWLVLWDSLSAGLIRAVLDISADPLIVENDGSVQVPAGSLAWSL